MNFVHKFNNTFALYILSYRFLPNFLARCARSIAFHPPLRNESMQCALPTPFIAYFCFFFCFFWGVIIPDWQLTKFTKTRIKLHKIAYTMSKNCLWGVAGKKGGKTWEWGNSPMVVGDRRPWVRSFLWRLLWFLEKYKSRLSWNVAHSCSVGLSVSNVIVIL